MKKNVGLLSLLGVLSWNVLLMGCGSRQVAGGDAAVHPDLLSYTSFLEEASQDPVEYVMGLFESSDLVILCERAHPEVTQYDFLLDLISDARFITRVGHIFTELGISTLNPALDEFLKSGELNETSADRKLLSVYRDLSFYPVWDYSNFYDFLKGIRRLNVALSAEEKVNVYFSDMPFRWQNMTPRAYEAFQETLSQRDRIMADQIINGFEEIESSDERRKKALVIMNYRHAFSDGFELPGGKKSDNTGRYLFEAFPGRVSNVMINALRVQIGSTDQDVRLAPVQDGKWDAAFKMVGDPAVGFDFKSSPFGQDEFDYYPRREKGLTYQDVFRGFVFYIPVDRHVFRAGIPGLFEHGFDEVAISRYVTAGMSLEEASSIIDSKKTPSESRYDDFDSIRTQIEVWLKAPESGGNEMDFIGIWRRSLRDSLNETPRSMVIQTEVTECVSIKLP